MARAGVAVAEAEAVGVDELRGVQADAGAFRIGQPLVDRQRRRFAGAGAFGCLFHAEIPRVVEIEIGHVLRQTVGVGQAGRLVLGGVARDGERLFDRAFQRRFRQVRGRGVAAPLADVDGDAGALVLVVLDGLDLALAHADALSDTLGNLGVGGGGALFGCMLDDDPGQGHELVAGIAELGAGHVGLSKEKGA